MTLQLAVTATFHLYFPRDGKDLEKIFKVSEDGMEV